MWRAFIPLLIFLGVSLPTGILYPTMQGSSIWKDMDSFWTNTPGFVSARVGHVKENSISVSLGQWRNLPSAYLATDRASMLSIVMPKLLYGLLPLAFADAVQAVVGPSAQLGWTCRIT